MMPSRKRTSCLAAHSGHPAVVEWWDAYVVKDRQWHQACNRLIRQLRPYPKAVGMSLSGFSTTFAGFQANADPAPEGWRLDRKRWMFVPHKATPKGKEIAAKIAALGSLPDPRLDIPGVPTDIITLPGMRKIGDEVWVHFSHARSDLDLTLWVPAKESEWYIAKESVEEVPA